MNSTAVLQPMPKIMNSHSFKLLLTSSCHRIPDETNPADPAQRQDDQVHADQSPGAAVRLLREGPGEFRGLSYDGPGSDDRLLGEDLHGHVQR